MSPGTPDLIFLMLVFLGLQAWWLIPLLKKNNKINEIDKQLSKEVRKLEKIYKK